MKDREGEHSRVQKTSKTKCQNIFFNISVTTLNLHSLNIARKIKRSLQWIYKTKEIMLCSLNYIRFKYKRLKVKR